MHRAEPRTSEEPRPTLRRPAAETLPRVFDEVFVGDSELAALCRDHDWAATPLGPVESWPQSLRTAAAIVLGAGYPMILVWGPRLVQLYNDAYASLIGRKHPHALGMPTHECWPALREIQTPIFEAVFRGETVRIVDAHYPLDRFGVVEDAYFDATFAPVPLEGGGIGGSLSTLVETTDRVCARGLREDHARLEAETRLAETRAEQLLVERDAARGLFQTVLDQLPVAVVVAEAPSGRVLATNHAVSRIWGAQRPLTESIARYSTEWVGHHPDGRLVRSGEWPLARAVKHGETITDWVCEVERADGTRAMVEITASPVLDGQDRTVAGVAVIVDITIRVEAERERQRLVRELEIERARLAEIFRQAPAFLSVMRGPSHRIELVNDAIYELVGRRELLGRPFAEALPDLAEQGFVDLLDHVLASCEPFVAREMAITLGRTPGAPPEERFVDFVYQPLVEADGTCAGIIGHGSDVTEQVRARRDVELAREMAERARAEAEEANRVKGQFLAAMSHELRTPLNAIGGYAELLEMGVRGPVNEQQRSDLERIQASQKHLLGLISEVLSYAKLETGNVRYAIADVPVRDTLAAVEGFVAPQARAKGLALTIGAVEPGLTVRADPERLRQILVNLLANAVKFTDRGGSIEIRCSATEAHVRLSVRDTGIGIPGDKLEQVFEPFVQVPADPSRRSEGTGLGLAISRDLARGMGGELTVDSVVGEGSTFVLALPASLGTE
ncbi:MAG TPA: ATP-binding protein [Gemmatimonadaceae bacterium]|nr:ATP-binding protein [Gemmatimonadaceae bacterium]